MSIRYYTSCFILLFVSLSAYSQNTITGKVVGGKDNAALANASVYIPDLKKGTITDANGAYTISDLPKGTFLVEASFVGFASQTSEVSVDGSTIADFTLTESAVQLNEV